MSHCCWLLCFLCCRLQQSRLKFECIWSCRLQVSGWFLFSLPSYLSRHSAVAIIWCLLTHSFRDTKLKGRLQEYSEEQCRSVVCLTVLNHLFSLARSWALGNLCFINICLWYHRGLCGKASTCNVFVVICLEMQCSKSLIIYLLLCIQYVQCEISITSD